MTVPEQVKAADAIKLSELTVGEFRALIRAEIHDLAREAVYEVWEEIKSGVDPDEGLEFKPEVAERLRKFMEEQPDGEPIDDILSELGMQE